MVLGHGGFGAVEAVEDELAEVGEADFAVAADVVLAGVIDEEEVVAFGLRAEVEVFADFDVALGAEDEGAALDIALNMDGSEFIHSNQIDWDIYSVDEVTND